MSIGVPAVNSLELSTVCVFSINQVDGCELLEAIQGHDVYMTKGNRLLFVSWDLVKIFS